MKPASMPAQVEAVRHFTRFYTRRLGVLNKALLDTEHSLPEARILFELAHQGETTAKALGEYLGMDAGYLSRLLAKLEKKGLVCRETDAKDARRRNLRLTPRGENAFAELDARSRQQVEAILEPMPSSGREKLVAVLSSAEDLLRAEPEPAKPFLVRDLQAGDIGWIVHRHGVLYDREYGWDQAFEALVARILGDFGSGHDPERERGWVAEADGEVVGSVFVMRAEEDVAQLRLLYVEPKMRGHGLGRALVDECVRFAKAKGYRRMTLWTNSVLEAARHIYAGSGFVLARSEAHHSFGRDLIGEYWELDLQEPRT